MKTILRALLLGFAALILSQPAMAATPWIEYTPERFARVQAAGETILVDVHADWCPTCKAQGPILERLRQDKRLGHTVFMRVDFDAEKAFLRAHRIPRQSTILVFRGRTETGRSIAETDPARLRSFVFKSVG
jgi:thiol:disulfide interchange protein